MLHALLLVILSQPSVFAFPQSASSDTLPAPINSTNIPTLTDNLDHPLNLTKVGPSCSTGDPQHHTPIFFSSCLSALGSAKHEPSPSYFLSQIWHTPQVQLSGVTVPKVWENAEAPKCYMVVNTLKPADAAQFSLIGVSYFASQVLEGCVQGKKEPLGGRFQISEGSFYVDVTGDLPPPPPREMDGQATTRDGSVVGGETW